MTAVDTHLPITRWVADRVRDQVATPALRRSIARSSGVLIGLGVLSAYLAISQSSFLTWANWENVFRAQGVVFVLAGGMTFVILTGGFDLSVASATALTSSMFGIVLVNGASWWLATLVALGTGLGLGLINGYLISVVRIPFFVVTLGTLSAYAGVALIVTNGTTQVLYSVRSFTPIGALATNDVGPFPIVLLLVAALYAIAGLTLRRTVFGRDVFLTGANREAARLAGIRVSIVVLSVYVLAGFTTGVAGVLQAGRLSAGSPQVDPNLMLTVVAAVLLGGTSFNGGDGGMFGTFMGVLFLGVIDNGLELSNVSAFWQGVVSGAILIAAVGLGAARRPGFSIRRLGLRLLGHMDPVEHRASDQ